MNIPILYASIRLETVLLFIRSQSEMFIISSYWIDQHRLLILVCRRLIVAYRIKFLSGIDRNTWREIYERRSFVGYEMLVCYCLRNHHLLTIAHVVPFPDNPPSSLLCISLSSYDARSGIRMETSAFDRNWQAVEAADWSGACQSHRLSEKGTAVPLRPLSLPLLLYPLWEPSFFPIEALRSRPPPPAPPRLALLSPRGVNDSATRLFTPSRSWMDSTTLFEICSLYLLSVAQLNAVEQRLAEWKFSAVCAILDRNCGGKFTKIGRWVDYGITFNVV